MKVGRILWAGNDDDHFNHLHVEPVTTLNDSGIDPPENNPGMTPELQEIYQALTAEFGAGDYFVNPDPEADWLHMGYYNRRPIAGSSTWSEHAYANALDIGPYYGVEEQRKFYDFLTGKETNMALQEYEKEAIERLEKDGIFTEFTTDEAGEINEHVKVRTLAVILDRVLDLMAKLASRQAETNVTRENVIKWLINELQD